MSRNDGLVRRARRPAGWIAPGPPPTGPRTDPALQPRAGEDLCYLAGDWRILQRLGGHRWSLDDLVTAWVATAALGTRTPHRFVDLGCGIGSVLLLLAWRFAGARGLGIEAQAESARLARRSIAWNGVAERCRVLEGDLRDPALLAGVGAAELVTGTPPYLPAGGAVASPDRQREACRIEHRGGLEAYVAAAARLLAPGGRFVTCAGPERPDRAARAATDHGLAITSILHVVPRQGKPALFDVYTLARADEPTTGSRGRLVVRDATGRFSPAFRRLRAAMGLPPGSGGRTVPTRPAPPSPRAEG